MLEQSNKSKEYIDNSLILLEKIFKLLSVKLKSKVNTKDISRLDTDLNSIKGNLRKQISELNDFLIKQNELIIKLDNENNLLKNDLIKTLEIKDSEISKINSINDRIEQEKNHYKNVIAEFNNQLILKENEIQNLKNSLISIKTSRIWRLLKPVRKIINLIMFLKHYHTINKSGLFDIEYYQDNYPDVKQTKIDPILHFYLYGAAEGRNPNSEFNTIFYCDTYPDVQQSGINPLYHYICFGKKENRLTKPINFTIKNRVNTLCKLTGKYHNWYQNQYPDQHLLDQQKVISGYLSNPRIFTFITPFRGDIVGLNKSMESLYNQTYIHWKYYIVFDNEYYTLENKLKLNKIAKNRKVITIIPSFRHLISNEELLSEHIGFLECGEILRPDCLWQFSQYLRNDTDLLYSDHDIIDEQQFHIDPWFTFEWSPDLLFSHNYIGGLYLIQSETFRTLIDSNFFDSSFDSFFKSQAWRYRILLMLNFISIHSIRIPKVLWSESKQKHNNSRFQQNYERMELEKFLIHYLPEAKLDNTIYEDLRHILWPIRNLPKVSIIIPTTGKMKYLKVCLDSLLLKTEYKNYEIILIDNGNGKHLDGIDYAQSLNVKIIEVNEEFNWSRLNNIGVENSNGELLLFLNDDTEIIEEGWLTELVRQSLREEIGIVGSLLLYPDKKIQHAGVFLVDHGGGARHIFHRSDYGESNYKHLDRCVREVSANTGACMMIRKNLFEEIGRFDEELPLVGNDIDLCLRCLEKGYRNLWTPYSKIIHHESVSRKDRPIESDELKMWEHWRRFFEKGDSYYNPNLTMKKEDFSLKAVEYNKKNSRKLDLDISNPQSFNSSHRNTRLELRSDITYSHGINLISYIRAEMGIGEAARGNAKAIEKVNIPYCVINYEKGNPSEMGNLSFEHKEVSTPIFDINLLHINADQTPLTVNQLGPKFFVNRYTIGFWAWELPEFPDKWLGSFKYIDEVWVPSDFVNNAIRKKANVPVTTIPHVVSINKNSSYLPKSYFGIPEDTFVFLNMFDTHSIIERKNPYGCIKAFKNAFKSKDKNVCLVLKINNPNEEDINKLKASISGYNIKLIAKYMTRFEIDSLLSNIDCFVSLHRSEGFGLGPAEAMAHGKVALLTNWSGNKQYMTNDNCIPISYELKMIGQDYGPYLADQQWAYPNLDEASEQMSRLANDQLLATEIGNIGKKTILENFSSENIGLLISKRFNEIILDQPQKINKEKI